MSLYIRCIVIITLVSLFTGCASKKPVLYPNAAFHKNQGMTPEQAVEQCMQMARDNGANTRQAGKIGRQTAASTATGAASGAVIGAISGSAGRGAAIGAVGGITASFFHHLFSAPEPDPVYRNFVDQCLREKGYQPIGWR